eukprot:TRINITY_DN12024_c0_g1_i1.p1 TRINITY_DN12024_c0_g1~~TRINITY_DN12024_c0_g1_i1.p1  ORF type:complete len:120 (+),score=16.99 TRINITY_DN12024_c0_g1_i1:206-565(+)
MITREKRNATVRAMQFCEMLVLNQSDLKRIIAIYPEIGASIAKFAPGANSMKSRWDRIRHAVKMYKQIRLIGGSTSFEEILSSLFSVGQTSPTSTTGVKKPAKLKSLSSMVFAKRALKI